MKNPITWKTETRRVRDLIEYQGNPRIISDHQMEILQKSLRKFSLAEIPAINTDNTVLAGNQRIKALALLEKMDEFIDVRVPSRKLTEKEAEEYLLVSNRGGGEWNWEALKSFSPDLLQNVGFTDLDFSRIWDDTLEIINDEFDEEKALKKARTTKIKVGDMFALGEHRVICGSSEDPEVIKRLVGNKRIDVMNSDVPYNIGLSYNTGVSGKQAYGGRTNDKKSDAEYHTFVSTLLANALSVTKKDAHFAIWSDERYNGMMQDLYKEHGIDFKRTCLWIKDNQNPTPKIAFNKSVEYCTYGVIGDPYIAKNVTNLTEVMNKEVGTGSRQLSDIVDLFNIWLVGRLPGQEYEHSTQKPPALYEKFLRRCTKSGDVVLDMTAGSGSLLIACEQMNRVARLCEIEPIFTQLILDRYEQLTNKKTKKID